MKNAARTTVASGAAPAHEPLRALGLLLAAAGEQHDAAHAGRGRRPASAATVSAAPGTARSGA